jgi:hypothetical protein
VERNFAFWLAITFPFFFLIQLFYTSIILAQILSMPLKFINSLEDLANANDVMLVARANTSTQIRFKVSSLKNKHSRRVILMPI